MNNVGNFCTANVVTTDRLAELTRAAQLMREKHVGYLVVVEPDLSTNAVKPIGVLTDRDIVIAVVAREVNPRTLTVGDVMTQQPVTVAEDASVSAALAEMRLIGVRRMPVVNRGGELVGVLSLDDILDALASELVNMAASIRAERRIEGALRP